MDEVDGVGWTVENTHALVARATATTVTTVTTATTASEGNIFSRTRRVVLRWIIVRASERAMFLYVIAFVYQYVLCQLLSICTVTKNCENMSSCRRVARESVLVVLAFSMIFFERNAFFAREGVGCIGARDMYIDLRFNRCIRYIIQYKRDLTPIYMGVGKRCAHRRATRRDETPSADARAV